MNSAPRVMVSSTFFDLRQIRADLARFITDELGYVALLSELPSFPVNPDLDTVENCRARVKEDADIFVLVIGARYGSIDDKTDKSITNLEFLAARQKGIPVYAFVEKGVWAVLPVWKRNPDADFLGSVDTPRVFEFVEYVTQQERVWTFPFESAQDITGTLRRQFAYLINDALSLRQRFTGSAFPASFHSLGPKALRIALERPAGWEYRLFLQAWIDQVEQRRTEIKEYRSRIAVGAAEFVPVQSAADWIQTRLHELRGFIDSGNRLISSSLQDAFGPPGVPGNPEDIVWVACMLGSLLENLLSWAKRIRCAHIQHPFETVGAELALLVDDLIDQFERFPAESLDKVVAAAEQPAGDEPRVVQLTIRFQLSNVDKLNAELEARRRQFEGGRAG